MNKGAKNFLIAGICFLAIGFAAVSATLTMNGNVTVGTNSDDFRVIFTDATVTNKDATATITDGGKNIDFNTNELTKVNDEVTLNYEISNFSRNYNVSVDILINGINIGQNEYFYVSKTEDWIVGSNNLIEAGNKSHGSITIKLTKLYEGSTPMEPIEFSVSMSVDSLERDRLANELLTSTGTKLYDIVKTSAGTKTDNDLDFDQMAGCASANSSDCVSGNSAYHDDNGLGAYKYTGLDSDGGNSDIYFYRGAVDDNNVIFNDYCWKIIRTTSLGGVKMLYNGSPSRQYASYEKLSTTDYSFEEGVDGKIEISSYLYPKANFTYDNTLNMWKNTIASSTESESIIAVVSVKENGYYKIHYNNKSSYALINLNSINNLAFTNTEKEDTVVIGNITPSDKIYIMIEGVADYENMIINFPEDLFEFELEKGSGTGSLSCINTTYNEHSPFNTIANHPKYVGYVFGDGIHANGSDSLIKQYVEDTWFNSSHFATNETAYNMLEDTPYCINRNVYTTSGVDPNVTYNALIEYDNDNLSNLYMYEGWKKLREKEEPTLLCDNENDILSVDNGRLSKKMGLLSYDEANLAGLVQNDNYTNYLSNSQTWLISPYSWWGNYASSFIIANKGYLGYGSNSVNNSVLPTITLLNRAKVSSGNGKAESPYNIIIE